MRYSKNIFQFAALNNLETYKTIKRIRFLFKTISVSILNTNVLQSSQKN